MKTNGFPCGLSGAVTLDATLPVPSSYIVVGTTAGAIVFENTAGENQYWPYASVGYNPIAAKKILTSATIDAVLRTTTAVGLAWAGSTPN